MNIRIVFKNLNRKNYLEETNDEHINNTDCEHALKI